MVIKKPRGQSALYVRETATLERRVGIRDLKAKLSECVREVKAGGTVVVTEHGRAVARIVPEPVSLREHMLALVKAGEIAWSGETYRPRKPAARLHGERTVAELIVEERDPRVMAYLDSSALVKCYIAEAGSLDTLDLIERAAMVATSPITRVEVASGIARAARRGSVASEQARGAYADFVAESHAIIQVPMTERVYARAQGFVWELGLRGYDAVQLASALAWQERLGIQVTVATFDTRLARAAVHAGVLVWPALTSAAGTIVRD